MAPTTSSTRRWPRRPGSPTKRDPSPASAKVLLAQRRFLRDRGWDWVMRQTFPLPGRSRSRRRRRLVLVELRRVCVLGVGLLRLVLVFLFRILVFLFLLRLVHRGDGRAPVLGVLRSHLDQEQLRQVLHHLLIEPGLLAPDPHLSVAQRSEEHT